MPNTHEQNQLLIFTLSNDSATKRPEQLVTLLNESLEKHFPEATGLIQITQSTNDTSVKLIQLDHLDEEIIEKIIHQARVIYNEFMINPWY